ncbi:hypothetical protein FOMPIDRAFT_1025527 [Fomitopsis schrenkii]|uniref:Uncharacterized protein n=1 Tax=Fomitopsis schrenkii TaxID=2126942 RepID=S8DTU8_FOMSC|nr:hypothetical protein FOMPIDRAFT_1025527 [Fomitopsis schrenkii]
MPTRHKIVKPCPVPNSWVSIYEATRMTIPAFNQFRELIDRVARKHLVVGRSITRQDQRHLQRCFAEIAACWPYEGSYENDWPIQSGLQLYLTYKSCHRLGGDRTWHFQVPGTRRTPVRRDRQEQEAEQKPAVQLIDRKPMLTPSGRRGIPRSKRVRPPRASTSAPHSAATTATTTRERVRCLVAHPSAAPTAIRPTAPRPGGAPLPDPQPARSPRLVRRDRPAAPDHVRHAAHWPRHRQRGAPLHSRAPPWARPLAQRVFARPRQVRILAPPARAGPAARRRWRGARGNVGLIGRGWVRIGEFRRKNPCCFHCVQSAVVFSMFCCLQLCSPPCLY